ncbi:hypothetical protein [Promineifilum sp.]|uniref:hypothetical protein n=1 Tax=Promineifilum sp. TaxID=2664178 RepID=UPI0035AEA70C
MTNLLLYTESRQTLARARGEAVMQPIASVWFDGPDLMFPDEFFEELSYRAADAPTSRLPLFDDLFDWRPAPQPAFAD